IRSWSCSDSTLTPTAAPFSPRLARRTYHRGLRRVPSLDPAEELAEPLEARDVVPGQEPVDVGEGRAHPGGERLVLRAALQRVDPDDRERLAGEPGHLPLEQARAC